MSETSIEIRVEGGDRSRLEDLYGKVQKATEISNLEAKATKGRASGSISVHGESKMTIAGRSVCNPEGLTVPGIVKLLQIVADQSQDESDAPLTLPFSERFRVLEPASRNGDMQIGKLVDDATGIIYLTCNGSLTPLLQASGKAQRV